MRSSPLIYLLLLAPLTAAKAESSDLPIPEARALVQAFVGELKPTLLAAMQTGGPSHAIEVCSKTAPDIATRLSVDGWQVKRVSSKARNPNAKPDPFESEVLATLETQRQAGTPAAGLNHAEQVEGEFRYLQAQLTGGVCLTCHGIEIAPDVAATLTRFYPQDSAVGYQAGEIRGAISLRYTPLQ